MDQNTPLDAQDRTAHRAENAEYGIAARQKFIDLSTELATLLVEHARTAITTAAPAKLQNHTANVETLFRGVRLSDKLLAPPTPEPAPRAARPTSTYRGINTQHLDNTDHLDRLDQIEPLDKIDKIDYSKELFEPSDPSASERILKLCRENNIREAPAACPSTNGPSPRSPPTPPA